MAVAWFTSVIEQDKEALSRIARAGRLVGFLFFKDLAITSYFSKRFAGAKSGDAHSGTASSCHWNVYSIMGGGRRGQRLA